MNSLIDLAMAPTSSSQGVTVIETLVALAILSILLALAAPQWRYLQDKWQISQIAQYMRSSLLFARSEAIRQGGHIGIQKHDNSSSCRSAPTRQQWSCGWFVFSDPNGDGAWQADEPKLQEIQLDGQVTVLHSARTRSIKVDRFGMTGGLNARSFVFFAANSPKTASTTQTLCMSSGGRIRIISDSHCTKS